MIQKEEIVDNIGSFLHDFVYSKIPGKEVFEQGFAEGRKLILLNVSPYADGMMLEVLLGISMLEVENILHEFSNRVFHPQDISLTYWKSLSSFSTHLPKRYFISSVSELHQILPDIEDVLVKKGFYWLDEFSDQQALASMMHQSIVSKEEDNKNLYLMSQRSLILQKLLNNVITDALFYTYYETLQLHKAPESQLEEFFKFRQYTEAIDL
ncbi:hypothetical protein GCM10011506_15420 [Marivirga lumbricoides]|uniref:Uncharacterized protein n=1 Tax=Marivirga lumbricoides TaxID=1046115 RepID=A0ABQ1LWY6_9BACT|nr:hypothetical protein GCM10011506_15420 [Marivirga lumbricoides]